MCICQGCNLLGILYLRQANIKY